MRRHALSAVCVAAIAAAGCMTVPDLPPEAQISIEAVANRVKCELRQAGEAEPWLFTDKWIGSVDLTLEVFDKGQAAGTLAFVVPVSHGTFTLGFTGGPTESVRRTVGVSFPFKMADLKN